MMPFWYLSCGFSDVVLIGMFKTWRVRGNAVPSGQPEHRKIMLIFRFRSGGEALRLTPRNPLLVRIREAIRKRYFEFKSPHAMCITVN